MRHLTWMMLGLLGACSVDYPEGQLTCFGQSDSGSCPPNWSCLQESMYGSWYCYSSADALSQGGSGGSGGTIFAGSGGGGGTVFAGSGGSSGTGGSGGTSGSGGSGGSPMTLTNLISCVETADPTDPANSKPGAEFCHCTSSGDPGAPSFMGDDCGTHPDRQLCCANALFPDAGSCTCKLVLDWFCETVEAGASCSCNYAYGDTSALPASPVCDAAPDPEGNFWKCCSDTVDFTCRCSISTPSRTCAAGFNDVADCATAALAGHPPLPSSCPAGTTQVNSCSE